MQTIIIMKPRYYQIFLYILSFAFFSCQAKPKVLYQDMQIYPSDQVVAPFEVTEADLVPTQKSVAFTSIQSTPTITRYERVLVKEFTSALLEKIAQLNILPDYRVQAALNRMEFQNTTLNATEISLRTGQILQVDYVFMLYLQPSTLENTQGDWKAKVHAQLYQVATQKLVWEQHFHYVASYSKKIWEQLRLKIAQVFPLRGFVIETREKGAWIKVNLGSNHGILPGEIIYAFRKTVKQEKSGNTMTTSTKYDALGAIRTTQIFPQELIGQVSKEASGRVLKGDTIFTVRPQ